ncbi:WD40 repeat-like protein [Pluteus cervinus]|uniref:WD40 repeat-like protein n=1 Tax=Pluteus cervinus TaxID=181527 RepID=A0ACD3B3P5_9AGAR|nr:WD40 repeat-like protein [Pluteus cervinus]
MAASSSSPIILPIASIQPTFPEVLRDVESGLVPSDRFWVSCYKEDAQSIHREVQAELDDTDRDLVNLSVVDANRGGETRYSVSCASLGISNTPIITPAQEYKDPERSGPQRPHRITAFDVAPDLSQFATGFLDGSVYLYPVNAVPASRDSSSSNRPSIPSPPDQITIPTKIRRVSKPHLSTITSLKFFPSSRVILTSSADFSLSILPADYPVEESTSSTSVRVQAARTLKGHIRSVTSTGIIGRGRNVISSSLDSTVRLWDVSSGNVITSLYAHSPVSCLSLGDRVLVPPHGDLEDGDNLRIEGDDRELPEARAKLVYCGLQNGGIQVFDLGSRNTVHSFKPSSTPTPTTSAGNITAIAHSESHHLLATATSRGIVTLYDTRSLGAPLTSFKRNDASIDSLNFFESDGDPETDHGRTGLVLGANDGLPYVANVIPHGPGVQMELIGSDCDAVRHVVTRRNGERKEIWTAGDDAIVRRYLV